MTTRIITFLVGDSFKPSFATATGPGSHPTYVLVLDMGGKVWKPMPSKSDSFV